MHKVLNKAQQIGAELVVRTLEMQGVTHVFGVPGAKIDAVFNASLTRLLRRSSAGTSRTRPSLRAGLDA